MTSQKKLLVLSCTQRKHEAAQLLPALERYDGPAFRVVRRFIREKPERAKHVEIFVLSAQYGLISAEQPITAYDRKMTGQRAKELRNEILPVFVKLIDSGFTDICLAMSATYSSVFKEYESSVSEPVSITITYGPQGDKLTQLKKWLWGSELPSRPTKHDTTQPIGVTRFRGVELRLTADQILNKARIALAEDHTGSERFREWYVDIDGRCVGPKWLVSRLTALPVSDFTSREARRALINLGIKVQRVLHGETDEDRNH